MLFFFSLISSTIFYYLIQYYEKKIYKGERVLFIKGILTLREKEVFELLIKNYSTKEIASELNISEKTVRNHISNTMQKLGVKGRASAVIELLRLKELSL